VLALATCSPGSSARRRLEHPFRLALVVQLKLEWPGGSQASPWQHRPAVKLNGGSTERSVVKEDHAVRVAWRRMPIAERRVLICLAKTGRPHPDFSVRADAIEWATVTQRPVLSPLVLTSVGVLTCSIVLSAVVPRGGVLVGAVAGVVIVVWGMATQWRLAKPVLAANVAPVEPVGPTVCNPGAGQGHEATTVAAEPQVRPRWLDQPTAPPSPPPNSFRRHSSAVYRRCHTASVRVRGLTSGRALGYGKSAAPSGSAFRVRHVSGRGGSVSDPSAKGLYSSSTNR
jgi:hypothetical protein